MDYIEEYAEQKKQPKYIFHYYFSPSQWEKQSNGASNFIVNGRTKMIRIDIQFERTLHFIHYWQVAFQENFS